MLTKPWGFSSAGRASALHAEGQEFESPNLQIKYTMTSVIVYFIIFQSILAIKILIIQKINFTQTLLHQSFHEVGGLGLCYCRVILYNRRIFYPL